MATYIVWKTWWKAQEPYRCHSRGLNTIWHEKASHAELFLSIIMQRVVYRAARSAQAGGRGAPPRTARCAVRHTF